VSSRDVVIDTLRRRLAAAEEEGGREEEADGLRREVKEEERRREEAHSLFSSLALSLAGGRKKEGEEREEEEERTEEAFNRLWNPEAPVNTCHGKRVEDFECLEASVALWEATCPPLNDHSFQYLGVLQRACDQGYPLSSLQNAITATCSSVTASSVTAFSVIASSVASTASPCHSLTEAAACEATAGCAWCQCAAVPSKCYTQAEAAKLPPAIFRCTS